MYDMVRGRVLETGAAEVDAVGKNFSGGERYTGIKVQTKDGQIVWIKNVTACMEIASILGNAVRQGGATELWLTGKEDKPHVYAIRTGQERYYTNELVKQFNKQAWKLFFIGIPMLLFLGSGVLAWIAAVMIWVCAPSYGARYTEEQFEAGWEEGVLGRLPEPTASPVIQAIAA